MSRLQDRTPRILRTIPLVREEQDILAAIEFDVHALDGPKDADRNGEQVCTLLRLFKARDALPAHRLSYFNDPEFNPGGRGRSRRAIFEKNGCSGEEIPRNPQFLDDLRYMVHGAKLPDAIIDGFAAAVDDCGMVTSSDYNHLIPSARQLARSHLGRPREYGDEFFNLAIDLGFSPSYALFFRDAVKAIR